VKPREAFDLKRNSQGLPARVAGPVWRMGVGVRQALDVSPVSLEEQSRELNDAVAVFRLKGDAAVR